MLPATAAKHSRACRCTFRPVKRKSISPISPLQENRQIQIRQHAFFDKTLCLNIGIPGVFGVDVQAGVFDAMTGKNDAACNKTSHLTMTP
jgi:hypothetical protein